MTMAGFLPPISTMQGLGKRDENRWNKWRKPMSNEPVNVRPSTSGCRASASPMTRPEPVRQLTVPAGRPASAKMPARIAPESGVSDEGFMMTVLPVTSAAATGAAISA